MPNPNGNKFTVEVLSIQGRPHIKFEDPFSHFLNSSNQSFEKISSFLLLILLLFAHFAEIAITHVCVL